MENKNKQDLIMENLTIPSILAIHDLSDSLSAEEIRDMAKKAFEEHCKKYGYDRNRLYLKLEETLEEKRKQRSSDGIQLYPYKYYENLESLLMSDNSDNINNKDNSIDILKEDDTER